MPVDLVEMIKEGGVPNGFTNVNYVANGEGELIQLGPINMRILEDGSRTDNRFGAVRFVIPPKTPGPPQHIHIMHDETFFVVKGVARFDTGTTHVDATTGDFVTVPPRSMHTFSNPFDEPAEMICTFTPAYYVEYFRLLARAAQSGQRLTPADMTAAMANYATLP
ncbi:RmlC-like cupin, partial [Exidia glandulosa HHB12029]